MDADYTPLSFRIVKKHKGKPQYRVLDIDTNRSSLRMRADTRYETEPVPTKEWKIASVDCVERFNDAPRAAALIFLAAASGNAPKPFAIYFSDKSARDSCLDCLALHKINIKVLSKHASRIHEFAAAKKAAAAAAAAKDGGAAKHPPLPPTPGAAAATATATAATATAATPAKPAVVATPTPTPTPTPAPVIAKPAATPSVAATATPTKAATPAATTPAAATATSPTATTAAAAGAGKPKATSAKASKVLGEVTDMKPSSPAAAVLDRVETDGSTATSSNISNAGANSKPGSGSAQAVALSPEQAAAYNKKVDSQRKRWHKFLKNHDLQKPGYILPKSNELKDLVRNGIPPELRGKVWYTMSGIAAVRHRQPFTYYQNLTKQQNPTAAAQIEKDLHRTFPNHVVYQNKNGAGITMLRRILHAYAVRNPSVGYCQSLNFIVGLFLLFMDEEDAFWLMVHLVEDVACIGMGESSSTTAQEGISFYYQRDLAGIRIDQLVFKSLVNEKLPKVGEKLTALKVPVEPLTINWFLCMLIHTLPLETVLRVWDCMFFEGIKVMFRACLTLLKLSEKLILRAEKMEELMILLRGFTNSAIDPDKFVETMFDRWFLGSFPMARIQFLRLFNKAIVENEPVRNYRDAAEGGGDKKKDSSKPAAGTVSKPGSVMLGKASSSPSVSVVAGGTVAMPPSAPRESVVVPPPPTDPAPPTPKASVAGEEVPPPPATRPSAPTVATAPKHRVSDSISGAMIPTMHRDTLPPPPDAAPSRISVAIAATPKPTRSTSRSNAQLPAKPRASSALPPLPPSTPAVAPQPAAADAEELPPLPPAESTPAAATEELPPLPPGANTAPALPATPTPAPAATQHMDTKHTQPKLPATPATKPALPAVPTKTSKPLPVPTARVQTAVPRVSVAVIASTAPPPAAVVPPMVVGMPVLPPPPSDYVAPVTNSYGQLNALVSVASTTAPVPGRKNVEISREKKISLSDAPTLDKNAPTLSALAAAVIVPAPAAGAAAKPALPATKSVPASPKSTVKVASVPENAPAPAVAMDANSVVTEEVSSVVSFSVGGINTGSVPASPSSSTGSSTPLVPATPTTPAPPAFGSKLPASSSAATTADEDKDFVRSDGHDSDNEAYDPKTDKLATAVQAAAASAGVDGSAEDALVMQKGKAATGDAKANTTTVQSVKSTAVSSGVATEAMFWPTNQPSAADAGGDGEADADAPDAAPAQSNPLSGLDPKFSDRFNDLNKHFDNLNPVMDSKRCASCDQPIASNERSTFALDQYWHSHHFACMGPCGKGLVGKTFMVHEGRPYCKEDYLAAHGRKCFKCKDYVLEGFGLGATNVAGPNGPIYHPKCIQCTKCHRAPSIGGGPHAIKLYPHPETGAYYCRACYEDQYSPRCHACSKPITDSGEAGVTVRGKQYHESCAGCVVCKRALKKLQAEGVEIYVADLNTDMMYCKRHGEPGDTASAHLMCSRCNEPLVSGDVGTIIGTNVQLHLVCAGDCAMCGKPPAVGEPLYQRLDQFFCHSDFLDLSFPSCVRCKLNIMYEQPTVFQDEQYHLNCMRCAGSNCTVQFQANSTNAFVRANTLYCTAHVPGGGSTSDLKSGGPITNNARSSFKGPIPMLGTGRGGALGLPPMLTPTPAPAPTRAPPAPPTAAAAIVSTEKCKACQKPLTTGTLLIRNNKYHSGCVACKRCGCAFPGGAGIIIKDDQFYCKTDYAELFAPKCLVCTLPITEGKIMTVGAATAPSKVHFSCFNCSACSKALDGKPFALKHQKLVCAECAVKK